MVVKGMVSIGGVSAILMYNDLPAPISNFVGMFRNAKCQCFFR